MGLSHTTILTNFPLYINYINIKKPKKNFTKKNTTLFGWCLFFNVKI